MIKGKKSKMKIRAKWFKMIIIKNKNKSIMVLKDEK